MDIPETETRASQESDSSYATWQQHRYDARAQCLHIPDSIAHRHGLDAIAYADVIIAGEERTGSMRGVAVLKGVPFKTMKIFTNHWNYTSWQVCDYLQLLNGHVPECVQADMERKAVCDAWWQRHPQACTTRKRACGLGVRPRGFGLQAPGSEAGTTKFAVDGCLHTFAYEDWSSREDDVHLRRDE